MNTTPLINRQAVKRMALSLSKSMRAGQFSRVSNDFLVRIHSRLSAIIREEVHKHPSIGKTLK
jgi:hypothetical protein